MNNKKYWLNFDFITLRVKDIEKMKDFYVKLLKIKILKDSEENEKKISDFRNQIKGNYKNGFFWKWNFEKWGWSKCISYSLFIAQKRKFYGRWRNLYQSKFDKNFPNTGEETVIIKSSTGIKLIIKNFVSEIKNLFKIWQLLYILLLTILKICIKINCNDYKIKYIIIK